MIQQKNYWSLLKNFTFLIKYIYRHTFFKICIYFPSNKEVIVPLKKDPRLYYKQKQEKKSLFIREAGNMHKIGLNKAANQEEGNLRIYINLL